MTASVSVRSLREALSDPAAYPYVPDRIDFEQTHISLVALAPPWVYKIKRPVSLGFLDFSTLEQRRHYCHEEVRLNRRLCPDTYEGVVPLVQTSEGLRVEVDPAHGEVVDVAVKMRYLNPSQFMDARLDRGEAPLADVDRAVRTLCSFYQSQTPTAEVAEAGWIEEIRTSTNENFEQTAEYVGSLISRPAYESLRYFTDRFFDHHTSLFHERRAGGFIVDGHGDLRLEHVHLTPERVCIYDCIEFNERFRHLDVAEDVAFLAMDLDQQGHRDLSRRFAERMATGLDDPSLPLLLDFYKCYRAYVRGKVEGLQAVEEDASAKAQARSRRAARHYFQWALRYAVAGSEPLVVVVMGRPGTGKSTQAAALAEALGWEHLSSDHVRKSKAGVPLEERPEDAVRKRLYSDEMTDATYDTLRARALERGRGHKGTILDATYSSPVRREQLRSALRAANVPHAFVELTAADDVLRARLGARDDGSAMGSDARAEDFNALDARYQAPDALEDPHHVRVGTERRAEATTLDILKALIRLTN